MSTLRFRLERRSSPEPNTGCTLWFGGQRDGGYGAIYDGIWTQGTIGAHTAAWALANNGLPPEGMEVCHRCDTPACINTDHLFLATHADNMRDMVRKGRSAAISRPGEASPNAKLTASQVLEIRALYDQGRSKKSLAKHFGIWRSTVYAIVTRQSWKYL